MVDAKNPPSFHDAIADAAQALAGSINAPDYDPKFAGMIIDVMHRFVTMPKAGQQGQGQPPAGGAGPAQPPAGGPGAPSPAGSGDSGGAGAPGGVGAPPGAGGPGGSGPPGGGAQTPPAAPTPGGMSQGLTPSPDELRRVLADVAGK